MRRLLIICLCIAFAGLVLAQETAVPPSISPSPTPTPVSRRLSQQETVRDWDEERVSFWINIYTLYDSSQTVLHDNVYPHIIYEILQFKPDEDGNSPSRTQTIEKTVAKYQEILNRLSSNSISYHEMSAEDWRVYNMFKPIDDPQKYVNAASRDRIRVQDGRRDLFVAGLKRSGRYRSGIETVLSTFNLPKQLVSLIFVESLFYPKAVSKVGAAGPWQLMPDTARRYIHVGADVDERFDPFISTMASAQVLKENFEKLDGSWPLALTAYNHGLAGMLRAKKQYANLEDIIRTYRSDSFKFASKNFYAQYLAAVDAYLNSERYFGNVELDQPLNYDRIRIPYPVYFKDLVALTGMSIGELSELNPALTAKVTNNDLPVPEGYPLRVPVGKGTEAVMALREKEPKKKPRASASSTNYEATSLPVPFDTLQNKK